MVLVENDEVATEIDFGSYLSAKSLHYIACLWSSKALYREVQGPICNKSAIKIFISATLTSCQFDNLLHFFQHFSFHFLILEFSNTRHSSEKNKSTNICTVKFDVSNFTPTFSWKRNNYELRWTSVHNSSFEAVACKSSSLSSGVEMTSSSLSLECLEDS